MNSAALIPEAHILAAFPALLFADSIGELEIVGVDEVADVSSGDIRAASQHILEACQQYSGHLISKLADGFLVYFERADRAIACATHIQTTLADRASLFPEDNVFPPRIGIYMGDLQLDRATSDWFAERYGSSIAVKLANDASPGGICLARTVYDVATCSLALRSTHLDVQDLEALENSSDAFALMMEASADPASVVSNLDTSPYTAQPAPVAASPASKSSVADRAPAEQAPIDIEEESEPSLGDIFSPELAQSEEALGTFLPTVSVDEQQPGVSTAADATRSNLKSPFTLSEFRREQLLVALAEHVGPIASLTMSQAEASATSPQELVTSLLQVVPKRDHSSFRMVAFNILTQDSTKHQNHSSSRPWEVL